MTRYWKLISILLVIVLSVGTFYIHSALATNGFPQMLIKKQSGNEEELDSVVISGNYIEEYYYEQLMLDLEGIEYWSERSFFEKVNGHYLPLEIQKLRKEYWNFTRGKTSNAVNYYEDDAFLAYSNISYDRSNDAFGYMFNISVLDKQTNKTTSFDFSVPNSKAYSFISTGSVQMVDDVLKVITYNDSRNNNEVEYHLYTFDIAGKKLNEGEVIVTVPYTDSEVSLLNERTIEQGNNYAVFSKKILGDFEEKEQETQGDDTEEVLQKEVATVELLVYHFATGKMETIELPEMLHEYELPYIYDGSHVFFSRIMEDRLEVIAYNLTNKQVEMESAIDWSDIDEGLQLTRIKDGKLYVVNKSNDTATVIVANLTTEETLYQGEIVIDDSTKNSDAIQSIDFYDIEFK